MSEIIIERLGHHGDGITSDGRFVPFTLPGERVDPGPPMQVLTASPARITPVCQHFGTCGGCALQHASDAYLADWKSDIVRRALNAHDLDADIAPAKSFPPQTRRRATFAGRRTKKGVQIGFHGRGSDQIVELKTCHLVIPEMLEIRPALEDLTRLGASRKGQVRLLVTATEAGWDIDVSDTKPLDPAIASSLAGIAQKHDLARVSWEGEAVITLRPPVITLGPVTVTPPPGMFLQASKAAEVMLIDAVKSAVGSADKIADLFAGCGTFTLPLAKQAEIHAVEGSAAMLQALDAGWRKGQGLKLVRTETRDLFRRPLQALEMKSLQAVVIDPPRAGAETQSHVLAASGPPVIASVSCNPVTFARDAAILTAGGYRLDWVQTVDQFRWSGHIEVVARFSR